MNEIPNWAYAEIVNVGLGFDVAGLNNAIWNHYLSQTGRQTDSASPCFTLFLKDLQKTGWIDRTRNELKRGKHTPTQTAVSPKVHQRPRKLSPSAEFKQKLKSFDFEFDKAERKPTPPPSIPNELSPYIEELIDLYNSGNWKDMNARRDFLLKLAKLEVAK